MRGSTALGTVGLCAALAGVSLAPAAHGAREGAAEPPAAVRIDCAGNPSALLEAPATVQHAENGELHQFWLLEDREDLWEPAPTEHEAIIRYRERVRGITPDTSPLAVIRRNREMFPWLERERAAERTINRLVESGAGRHRPLTCLENRLLAFQASRFSLFDQPTEIAALVLRREEHGRPQVKVYVLSDDDGPPPKPTYALPAMAADIERGWRLASTFHNHTVKLEGERGHLAIPAPSSDDLNVFRFLHRDFGLELAQVTDGFSTHELTAAEFLAMAEAVDEAVVPTKTEPAPETEPARASEPEG